MKRVRYAKSDKAVTDAVVQASKPHVSEYHNGHGAYDKKYPGIAKFLCQRGATLAELADAFDVTIRAISNWQSKYPEFGEAVNEGAHEQFDIRVERSLAESALGYSVDVEEWFVVSGELVSQTVRKYYPPNVTAQIFWLKNRLPEKYRDVQRFDINQTGLKSADELRKLLAAEFKDLVDQGLLSLPAPRKMKDVTPRGGNGHGS